MQKKKKKKKAKNDEIQINENVFNDEDLWTCAAQAQRESKLMHMQIATQLRGN